MSNAVAGADTYGHHPARNNYRRYYVLEYYWGGRIILYRAEDFARALAVAKEELSRQGRGASLHIVPRDQDVALSRQDDDLIEGDYTKEQHRDGKNPDWKFKAIWVAHRHNAPHELTEATSKEASSSVWPHGTSQPSRA